MIARPSCLVLRVHTLTGSASSLAAMALLASLASLAACGGAGEAKSPGDMKGAEPPEREPSSIEEAQQRIADAKAELGGRGAPGTGTPFAEPPPGAADAARPPEPSPSPPPRSTVPMQRPSTSTSESAPAKAGQTTDDRCGGPCRALSSMRRAVTALCRMTGNEDARCVDAKRTLADSEGRIAPCSC